MPGRIRKKRPYEPPTVADTLSFESLEDEYESDGKLFKQNHSSRARLRENRDLERGYLHHMSRSTSSDEETYSVPLDFDELDKNISNIVMAAKAEREVRPEQQVDETAINKILKSMETTSLWLRPFAALFSFLNKVLCSYEIDMGYKKARKKKHVGDPTRMLRQNMCGLFFGVIIGFFCYILFLLTFSNNPRLSTLLSAYLMLVSVFGIAFSADFRCVTLLTLPYLAASRVRWLTMLFASSMTVAGPGLNFLHNSGNFRNAIACVLAQVSTNMLLIQKLTAAPFALMKSQLFGLIGSLNEVLQKMRSTLMSINLSLFKVTNVMNQQSSWVRSLVESCTDKVALQNQCLAFFNNIYFNCKASLGVFSFVCGAVRHFASDTCTSVESLAKMCKNQEELLEDKINISTTNELDEKMNVILDLLGRENLTLQGDFTQFETLAIRSDDTVVRILQQRMDSFIRTVEHGKTVLSWILVVWSLITMMQLIAQAANFRRKWMSSDIFDNVYITPAFIQQERRALQQGLVPTVPLIRKEKRDYRKFSSFRWATSEKHKAFRSFLIIFLWMLSLIVVIFADYAMHEVLVTMSPVFSVDFSDYGSGSRVGKDYESDEVKQPKMPEVKGKTSFANIIRSMVGMLNPIKDVALDIDATACKPTATPPDHERNKFIVFLLCCTVFSIFIEVYVLRLRHMIMIWYYPIRAVQRAAWLRTHIRNNRGLFHRLLHKFRAVDVKPGRRAPRVSCIGRILAQNPRLRSALEVVGIKRITCAYCGEEGNPKKKQEFEEFFVQCAECGAYFCKLCQADLDNICMICKTPLFALSVEIDFEQLSSDEEFEAICARYLRRAEQTTVKIKPGMRPR
ncbi:unnamed protein product [Calicophoron daubneyi]|uniref:Dendritic cell-specific transmembrane protein-like domain-containing protein n=1 Tax=Calicophoron daubneyi TaxID=300641 RepID=A0AAV2TVX1_CALDB